MSRDWTGNKSSVFSMIGARNYASENREERDYYATEPKAVDLLLSVEKFSPAIWECACGEGHISTKLEQAGYEVISTDLYYRGYGKNQPLDFLKTNIKEFDGDIITNPPYKFAMQFVEQSLCVIKEGHKVAMFLKLQFLEGKARKKLFEKYPPKVVYVSSGRLRCAKNGDFEKYKNMNAVSYAWFVWVKGWKGDTVIKWIG